MTTLEYKGITKEELDTIITPALNEIVRLGPEETREVSGVDPITKEPFSRTENLPRAVRIQTSSIESTPDGHCKLTLQGDAEAEEIAALEGRLSALAAKKV